MISSLKNITLKILVFGPSPKIAYPAGPMADLAKKRQEIKDVLAKDGHVAAFPEDLMVGVFDPAIENEYVWEQMLVQEYDMVVNLVWSPGAISELGLFMSPDLARKAALFFNEDHKSGLPFKQAQAIKDMGGQLDTYVYPNDLASCNLMTQIREKVRAVRIGKFYTS